MYYLYTSVICTLYSIIICYSHYFITFDIYYLHTGFYSHSELKTDECQATGVPVMLWAPAPVVPRTWHGSGRQEGGMQEVLGCHGATPYMNGMTLQRL